MRRRTIIGAAALAAVAMVFLAGLSLGAGSEIGFRPGAMTGDAAVGDHVLTVTSGVTPHGVADSVAWADSTGSFHPDGWPDRLEGPAQMKGLAFAGGAVWRGSTGVATVLWVDCRGR